ncbi:MAG TPA: hypothetical protein VGW34_04165 [Allosphingosinicella sp.]|nr:hypothetical protein [Allosphingosinicella sp.]
MAFLLLGGVSLPVRPVLGLRHGFGGLRDFVRRVTRVFELREPPRRASEWWIGIVFVPSHRLLLKRTELFSSTDARRLAADPRNGLSEFPTLHVPAAQVN